MVITIWNVPISPPRHDPRHSPAIWTVNSSATADPPRSRTAWAGASTDRPLSPVSDNCPSWRALSSYPRHRTPTPGCPSFRGNAPDSPAREHSTRPSSCRRSSPGAASCMRTLDCRPGHGNSSNRSSRRTCDPSCPDSFLFPCCGSVEEEVGYELINIKSLLG